MGDLENRTVVRVSRSAWWDGRRLRCETVLTVQKRLSSGHNCLIEETSNIGSDELVGCFTNLNTVAPGLYEVVFEYTGSGEFTELESATLIPFIKGADDERHAPR